MVELLESLPSHVLAYRAAGKVNEGEYERIVMRRADEVARRFGSLNFLVKLETGMENYSLAALIDYVKISFKHIHRWNRMAIVSDQESVRKFYDALSPLVPGKIIGFPLEDFEKAKAWVSEPFLTDENLLQSGWKSGLAAGMAGTTAMTFVSLLASRIWKTNFNEAALLGSLIRSRYPALPEPASRMIGWQCHYTFGLAWASVYGLFRNERRPLASGLAFGLAFGSLGGILGILLWKKAFSISPPPLPFDRKKFYLQLFAAHLVFGWVVRRSYERDLTRFASFRRC